MKKIFSKEVIIGFCVILALVILFVGIEFLKGVNIFQPVNHYYASYTNVDGLAVSAPVNINGFKVGLVRDIAYEYDNPGHIRVELSLDDKLRLPEGTKAVMATDLLGTAAIELKLADSDTFIPVGSKLESEHASGLMDAVSNNLMPAVDRIVPKVDSLLTNLNALTGDPALLASIQRLDAITANLQSMSQRLAAVSANLQPIATDIKAITGNVTNITDDAGQLTAQLRNLPVDSLVADLQATIANLQSLSDQLANPDGTIGKLSKDPQLYNNLNSTISSLDSLFVDIKRNPKRYISIKLL